MNLQWLFRLQRRLSGAGGTDTARLTEADWQALTAEEAFSHIYRHRLWGGNSGYHSGPGSRDPKVVAPYVMAVRHWAAGMGPMDAVDLGCGDFHVGRALRPLFQAYVACDVVPALIRHHQAGPDAATVDFRCLDLATDPLPDGDVVFLRQVLQHLPNAMIQALIPRLYAYRWLVLTEHLPLGADYPANLDKPIGPGIRLRQGSGIDLCAEPFGLQVLDARILCEAPQKGGTVRTVLYQLQP